MESNHVLEELEAAVTNVAAREVCDGGVAGPGEDGHKGDTNDHGTADLVGHEQCSEDSTYHEAEPHSRRGGLVRKTGASVRVKVLSRAASKLKRGGLRASDGTDTSRVGQTDQSEEETDTGTASDLDGGRNDASKPLTDTEKRKSDEDEAFDEHCHHGDAVVDRSTSMETNNLVGKVGVQTHGRCKSNRQVGGETHEERAKGSNGSSGSDEISVNLNKTEVVLCVVETSRVLSIIADACGTGVSEYRRLDVVDQPLSKVISETKLTLTAMMYAMVKNVVRPARSSVVNLAPLISLGCHCQYLLLVFRRHCTYMTRSLKVEVPPHYGA